MERLFLVAVCLVAWVASARAESVRQGEARAAFEHGKQAYQRRDFRTAHHDFERAYLLSQAPELLYNISSALEGLGCPHEAAEALRRYLARRPADADAARIRAHIRQLEEAQRDLDAIAHSQGPAATNQSASVPAEALTATPAKKRSSRRTAIIVGVSVGAAVLIGVGVGLGVGLGSPSTKYPAANDTVSF